MLITCPGRLPLSTRCYEVGHTRCYEVGHTRQECQPTSGYASAARGPRPTETENRTEPQPANNEGETQISESDSIDKANIITTEE